MKAQKEAQKKRDDDRMKAMEISLEDMRKKQEEQNQGRILDEFYEEMKSYNMVGGILIVTIIMDIIAGIFMCFPYQDIKEAEMTFLIFVLGFNGASFYLQGYRNFMERGSTHTIDEKIKYLPISKNTLNKWRMQKFIRYCTKRTCVFLGLQLFFTLVCVKHFTWGNFLFPFLTGFVLPVGVFGIPHYLKK